VKNDQPKLARRYHANLSALNARRIFPDGLAVQDRPVRAPDFVATIPKTLGVNHTRRVQLRGRPIGLVDGEARPLDELFR
jgi:hypothetical protein